MKKWLPLLFVIILVQCEGTEKSNPVEVSNDLIAGKWKTVRDDCDVYTTFNLNDSLRLERNQRIITGTYVLSPRSSKYQLSMHYVSDDLNYANACPGDASIGADFTGARIDIIFTLSSDSNQIQFDYNGDTTIMNRVE